MRSNGEEPGWFPPLRQSDHTFTSADLAGPGFPELTLRVAHWYKQTELDRPLSHAPCEATVTRDEPLDLTRPHKLVYMRQVPEYSWKSGEKLSLIPLRRG